ncbi:hypothetical protein F2Q68_00044345 [Brassica cretica]|uniref:Uncharacterized protein n=1 Tax=Brassica cretica TaxID=69181 RepID=A0A8S9LLW1_BRACR|nr:hypothetical protein F2Q68_00044345 [Brassica cretica]
MWELNTLHRAWYCKLSKITLLLQCYPHPHLFSSFTEHSPDVFFFLSGFSEEHPRSVGIISIFEWLIYRNPEDSLPETFLFLIIVPPPVFRCFATLSFLLLRVLPVGTLSSSIGSSPSSECVLTTSGGYSEGLGLGLSALSRATSIFGICTRWVIGARRSIGAGGCRSMAASECRSLRILRVD